MSTIKAQEELKKEQEREAEKLYEEWLRRKVRKSGGGETVRPMVEEKGEEIRGWRNCTTNG